MTYLVLARKWRPRSFETLVGQDHVVRALTHALQTQRLHHAWLFTGTRGVGKTTLSRLLAKSLNCETGITAQPCGKCRACTEIDAGRFVDYIELDAASNRGVEEMTQLLEQAVYAPSSGRFKVYMIDEVHMLTGHAFNAMLKTLEEPPPHVKFILATTDPQKIPVTVLSRCLQFNLKQMPAEAIVGHLQHVLQAESIAFEVPALRLIAQAAGGSMRDALSLTDQAIAYSADNLTEEAVRGMLGAIDQRHLVRLLDVLSAGQAEGVIALADELAARGLSYSGALADLSTMLSRIAIAQRAPGALPDDDPMTAEYVRLAGQMHPDAVQLFYSVAVHSRSELSLAPDEYAGFIMACLRMLALFAEAGGAPAAPVTPPPAPAVVAPDRTVSAPAPVAVAAPVDAKPVVADTLVAAPVAVPAVMAVAQPVVAESSEAVATAGDETANTSASADIPPWDDIPPDAEAAGASTWAEEDAVASDPVQTVATPTPTPTPTPEPERQTIAPVSAVRPETEALSLPEQAHAVTPESIATPVEVRDPVSQAAVEPSAAAATRQAAPGELALSQPWHVFSRSLPVRGGAEQLARQSEWLGTQGNVVRIRVANQALADISAKDRLRDALSEHFGQDIRLEIEVGATGSETAHAQDEAARRARQLAAEQSIASDPLVQALQSDFGGRVLSGSIRPSTQGL
ncbi:DNA polymerase III subunit gamma/tau [Alcaligenaceae bacterium SJ-26]|nr:DNA polymerase III subunit gamma/tau [Alcaligenaceae bacterium SJ-26]